MNKKTFRQEYEKAMKRVHAMDRVDKFKDRDLRTILSALQCGITTRKEVLFDVVVMLDDIHEKIYGKSFIFEGDKNE